MDGVSEEPAKPPEAAGWLTIRLAMLEFRMHGWFERIKLYAETVLTELRESLKTYQEENERGPPDYALDEAADRAVRRSLRARVNIQNDGPSNEGGSQSWQTWVLGIVGLLIAAGVGALNYQLSDLKADVKASLTRQELDEKRMERDEKRMDTMESKLYRGTTD